MNSTIKWFQSYLSGHSQRVVQNKMFSATLPIHNGVLQGSILGPLLFILLTCDISDCISNSNHHMYADDTQLYVHSSLNDIESAVSNLKADLNAVKQ